MKKEITEKDIDEIVKTFPNPRIMAPNEGFEDQMKTHLKKYLGFYKPPKIEQEGSNKKKKREK